MALPVRIRAWRDRRRTRRHERRDEKLIALSHEPLQDRRVDPEGHGKKHGVDIETAIADHYDKDLDATLRATERATEDEFRPPKY
jgi:hypothetical protein